MLTSRYILSVHTGGGNVAHYLIRVPGTCQYVLAAKPNRTFVCLEDLVEHYRRRPVPVSCGVINPAAVPCCKAQGFRSSHLFLTIFSFKPSSHPYLSLPSHSLPDLPECRPAKARLWRQRHELSSINAVKFHAFS